MSVLVAKHDVANPLENIGLDAGHTSLHKFKIAVRSREDAKEIVETI
jgi:hypothetical protein